MVIEIIQIELWPNVKVFVLNVQSRPCQTESDLSESVGKSRFKSSVRSDFYITHKDDSRSILELPLWLGGVRNLPNLQGSGLGPALAVVETLEVSGA